VCMQAVWRGHSLRRHTDEKVREACKKVQEATRNVKEEDKLYNRTSSALDFLLSRRWLRDPASKHVLKSLTELRL